MLETLQCTTCRRLCRAVSRPELIVGRRRRPHDVQANFILGCLFRASSQARDEAAGLGFELPQGPDGRRHYGDVETPARGR